MTDLHTGSKEWSVPATHESRGYQGELRRMREDWQRDTLGVGLSDAQDISARRWRLGWMRSGVSATFAGIEAVGDVATDPDRLKNLAAGLVVVVAVGAWAVDTAVTRPSVGDVADCSGPSRLPMTMGGDWIKRVLRPLADDQESVGSITDAVRQKVNYSVTDIDVAMANRKYIKVTAPGHYQDDVDHRGDVCIDVPTPIYQGEMEADGTQSIAQIAAAQHMSVRRLESINGLVGINPAYVVPNGQRLFLRNDRKLNTRWVLQPNPQDGLPIRSAAGRLAETYNRSAIETGKIRKGDPVYLPLTAKSPRGFTPRQIRTAYTVRQPR